MTGTANTADLKQALLWYISDLSLSLVLELTSCCPGGSYILEYGQTGYGMACNRYYEFEN